MVAAPAGSRDRRADLRRAAAGPGPPTACRARLRRVLRVRALRGGPPRGRPRTRRRCSSSWSALFLVLAGMGSGVYTVAFLVVGVIMLVPGRWGTLGAVVASAGAVPAVWLLSGTLTWSDVIGTAAVCVAQIGMFGVIRINAQLRAARDELAELAVTAERERMARDLHDVLGHSLTTITVKAGLARRLLEAGEHARAARRGGRRRAAGSPGAFGRARDRRRQPGRVVAAASSRAPRRRCAPPGSPPTCRTPSTTSRPSGRRCSPTSCARASPTSSGTAGRAGARSG